MNYEVIFYEDDRGYSPVNQFLDELQAQAKKNKRVKSLLTKIALYIEVLEASGTYSGLPYTKPIEGGIWELRPKDHRIFFFVWEGNKIVLLHTFVKKSQKTPHREIEKAKREMADWKTHGKERLKRKNRD